MTIFIDSFTEKSVKVEYKGKYYHFELLTGCGWAASLPNGEGSPKKDHPKGAWDALERLFVAHPEPEGEVITKEWVQANDPEYAHTWDWEEHPEDRNDWCWCETCRSYMD